MPDYQVVVSIDLSVFVSRMQCSAKLLRSGALLIRDRPQIETVPGLRHNTSPWPAKTGVNALKARAAPRPGHVFYFIGCGVKPGHDRPTI
jgi:hypothetical protein